MGESSSRAEIIRFARFRAGCIPNKMKYERRANTILRRSRRIVMYSSIAYTRTRRSLKYVYVLPLVSHRKLQPNNRLQDLAVCLVIGRRWRSNCPIVGYFMHDRNPK